MHSSLNVPLDSNPQQPAGYPEEWVGCAQGLHACSLQRPASRICVGPQLGELWLDELRSLHKLVRHGFSEPELDDFSRRCSCTLPLCPQEHLGACLSMGLDCLLLPDVQRSHQREWLVVTAGALLRNHLIQHWLHRPDCHWRQHNHVPVLRR